VCSSCHPQNWKLASVRSEEDDLSAGARLPQLLRESRPLIPGKTHIQNDAAGTIEPRSRRKPSTFSNDIARKPASSNRSSTMCVCPHHHQSRTWSVILSKDCQDLDSFRINLPQPYQRSWSAGRYLCKCGVQKNLCRDCDDVVAII
jgi:hypothetical protein